ncbi:MAG: endonuclease/exonuclease/phosphatase family protein [Canibacter sp.]
MEIISYNLRKHRAVHELHELASQHDTDILCLQEADTKKLPPKIANLTLADVTQSNRLGLAIYFRDDRFELNKTRTYQLKKSLHDRALSPAHERLLGALVTDRKHDLPLLVASFHAAPLTAANLLRRHQISAALGKLRGFARVPTVMIGDFNYPWFNRRLGERMHNAGYLLSKGDSRTYTRYKLFRGYYDFATTRDLVIRGLKTLPQGSSDHMPVLLSAEFHEDIKDQAQIR